MMGMSNKHNKRPTRFTGITSDRISSLPDEIIHHIMSFMTARDAVQTCVLSTRWRHIWQSLPYLTIAGPEFTTRKGLVKFMDNLLLRRDRVPLDSFCITDWRHGVALDHPRSNLWVCHALRSNVRAIQIIQYYELFNLDHSSFTSTHLKILNLSCVSISALFIEKLFAGCPGLEELTMIDCRVLATKFSSRTLKNFILTSLCPDFEDEYVHDDFEDLMIDMPSLVSLHLDDLPLLAPCLVNVSSLVEASIFLHEECFSSSDANCTILSALSTVADLKLSSPTCNEVLIRDLWRCQTFNNLKTLYVDDWCVDADLHALVYFLRCSPMLEKLTLCLKKVEALDGGRPKDNLEAKETNMSFNCEHLKKIKIRCPQGDKRVHNIVKVILANANSLPKIAIKPYNPLE